ncbi:hypothetical protein KKF55_00635 [Patescibacteria group bacterium]|nr:hypothetical protein [Patescibacteria group bacterium]
MKKFLHSILGLLLLVILLAPNKTAGMYGLARMLTNDEFNGISSGISQFINHRQVFVRPDDDPFSIADIADAMAYRSDKICKRRGKPAPCDIAQPVRDIARRENLARILQRDLHLIATGYELPITDHSMGPASLAPRMSSIIRTWQSSSDWLFTPVTERRIRSQAFPTKEEDPELYLLVMGEEDSDGVVLTRGIRHLASEEVAQRYRWGVKTVKREDPQLENCTKWYECDDWLKCWKEQDNDTELRLTFQRYCAEKQYIEFSLEDKLLEVLDHLRTNMQFDPPLQHGETVIFPPWNLGDPLNPIESNIFMWTYLNYSEEKSVIGLGTVSSLEPIMLKMDCSWENNEYETPACVPGLTGDICYRPDIDEETREKCKKGAILGGMYLNPPIEPPPTEKMCTMPFSSHGYLCKEVDQTRCPQQEVDDNGNPVPEEGIVLTRCDPDNLTGGVLSTESGPDACRIGGWRSDPVGYKNSVGEIVPVNDTIKRDDHINAPFACSNCAVDIYCDGNGKIVYEDGERIDLRNCPDGFAWTYPKGKDGVIPICLPKTDSINSYLLLHELVHVQQQCNLPTGTDLWNDRESCCATEVPAYYAQCSAMAEDGNFEGTDITVEICASVQSNHSCQNHMEEGSEIGACTGTAYSEEEWEIWDDKIMNAGSKNLAKLHTKCEDVITDMDPRVEMFRNSLPLVCTPECQAEYANTIGNNACYIAQCVEESLETQRIIPGRTTFVSQGEAFPWESDIKPDPLIGSIMPIPPLPFTRIPSYNPELLVKGMDLALCQLSGLPILQPPHLCAFHAIRQIALRPVSNSLLGIGLVGQTSQGQEEAWTVQSMASSIGVRLGTGLYVQYLERAGKSFWELIRSANELIGGIANVEFPKDSCPRYNSN